MLTSRSTTDRFAILRTTSIRSTVFLSGWVVLFCIVLSGCQRPEPAPESKPATDSITGIEWVVVEVDGQPAAQGAGDKSATLLFTAEGNQASGFAGCNRLSATYERVGDQLRFAPILMTKMACDQGMDLESAYSTALEATRTTRSTPAQLELIDETGRVRVLLSRPAP